MKVQGVYSKMVGFLSSHYKCFACLLKRHRLILVLIGVYFVLRPLWKNLFADFIVDTIASKFDIGFLSDWVIGIVAFWIVCSFVSMYKRNVVISAKLFDVSFFVLILWLGCRLRLSNAFNLYSLASISWLYYVDVIALAAGGVVLLYGFGKLRSIKSQTNSVDKRSGFVVDSPIEKVEEDILGRSVFACDVVEKMMATNTESNAFSLGIVGKWGEGKSSFMKMMKGYVQEKCEDVVIVEYSPWLYCEGTNVTRDFFQELTSALSSSGLFLQKQIGRYVDVLDSAEMPLGKLLAKLLHICSSRTVSEIAQEISKSMRENGKRIVVFIDDIDRLGANEMADVFKLVRNTSNFPNIYFILAYDKDYVVEMLKEKYGEHNIRFADKIVQEEYYLPQIQPLHIRECFRKTIASLYKVEEYAGEMKSLVNVLFVEEGLFEKAFTLRDLKRLLNAFYAEFQSLRDEVVAYDLLLVILLHQKFPKVYELIDSIGEQIFVVEESNRIFIPEDKKDVNDSDGLHEKRMFLYDYIEKNRGLLHVSSFENLCLFRLLRMMWGKGRISMPKAINNELYFRRYFYHNILDQELSEQEFNRLLKVDFDSVKKDLRVQVQNKSRYLVRRICRIHPQSFDESKRLLRLMFYINSISPRWQFERNDIDGIIQSLKRYHQSITGFTKEDKELVKSVLMENLECKATIQYLKDSKKSYNFSDDYPLSSEEICLIKKKLFLRYSKIHEDDFCAVSAIFREAVPIIGRDKGKWYPDVYDQECIAILKRCALGDIKHFIPESLVYTIPNEEHKYKLGFFPMVLWENKRQFVEDVRSLEPTDEVIAEYKRFVEIIKDLPDGVCVTFYFNHIVLDDN